MSDFQQLDLNAKLDRILTLLQDRQSSGLKTALLFVVLQVCGALVGLVVQQALNEVFPGAIPAKVRAIKTWWKCVTPSKVRGEAIRVITRPVKAYATYVKYARDSQPIAIVPAAHVGRNWRRGKWTYLEWFDDSGLFLQGWVRSKYLDRV